MPNPWVSLRCDQHIPVNKAVNEKGQKGWRRSRKKKKNKKQNNHPKGENSPNPVTLVGVHICVISANGIFCE
jgi:hypothetical protein